MQSVLFLTTVYSYILQTMVILQISGHWEYSFLFLFCNFSVTHGLRGWRAKVINTLWRCIEVSKETRISFLDFVQIFVSLISIYLQFYYAFNALGFCLSFQIFIITSKSNQETYNILDMWAEGTLFLFIFFKNPRMLKQHY